MLKQLEHVATLPTIRFRPERVALTCGRLRGRLQRQPEPMHNFVVGIDNGGTKTNATVLAVDGTFLVDRMLEVPSRVSHGPDAAIEARRRRRPCER